MNIEEKNETIKLLLQAIKNKEELSLAIKILVAKLEKEVWP